MRLFIPILPPQSVVHRLADRDTTIPHRQSGLIDCLRPIKSVYHILFVKCSCHIHDYAWFVTKGRASALPSVCFLK